MVSRELRLRHEFEVRQVRSRGRAHAEGPIVIRVLPNELEPAQNRYAFVAGKRVGKAHERNRTKRLCREAIRFYHPRLKPGHDLVVIVRGNVAELPSFEVARAIIERLLTRARLFQPGEPAPIDRSAPTEGGR
ncbi:MAG: ribonuclease P protein component [Thermomicrobiales bacterium]